MKHSSALVDLVSGRRSCWFLLSVLLLVLSASSSSSSWLVSADTAATTEEIVTAAGAEENECVMGADETCLASSTSDNITGTTSDTANMNASIPVSPPDGVLVDTGYGEPQRVTGPQAVETQTRIDEIIVYMRDRVFGDTSPDNRILQSVAAECQMRNELCAFWAVIGECTANPGYMTIQCAPACMTCEQLAFETRCPMPKELNNTWEPGSLNAMFDRIVNSTSTVTLRDDYPNLDASQKPYAVQVLKQPKKNAAADDEASTSDDALWVEDEPWVVIVDDFLTDHECDTLIELGGVQGYLQSKDVGEKKFDGTYGAHLSSGRTSTNAWCQEACFENNITQRVIAKIEALTGIPDANAEYLQLLKYEETQFYQQHHDYIEHHTERAQGVRILTVFLYLNDVEEGGGTNFPILNVTVEAKRGRALVWPSVLDRQPDMKDGRTDHQALPVIKGTKYGANAWLHQRDFKAPYLINCI